TGRSAPTPRSALRPYPGTCGDGRRAHATTSRAGPHRSGAGRRPRVRTATGTDLARSPPARLLLLRSPSGTSFGPYALLCSIAPHRGAGRTPDVPSVQLPTPLVTTRSSESYPLRIRSNGKSALVGWLLLVSAWLRSAARGASRAC